MLKYFRGLLNTAKHNPKLGGLEIFKYIGPGLLVTVGFIDPGNWASNLAAGAEFGYSLLWMVTLSTIMLIVLQHNVAHLGIATGLCLSEAASEYLKPRYAKGILYSAMLASVSTSLAEILGGAIALQMLFNIPIRAGSLLVMIFVAIMLFSNTYRVIEKWIIAFVSIIGLSFIYELSLVDIDWNTALPAWVTPAFPKGSMVVIMSVLGAVVMPHNLFLHSEVIQSRQWNIQDDKVIKKQLRYEYADTILSMVIGWAINSAMILLAAATFFKSGTPVTELEQANSLLTPLLGSNAAVIFAVALLFAGISSTITSGMAAGSIFAGIYKEPYDIKDSHSRIGVLTSLIIAFALIMVISNPFQGLIYSQMALSVQLPITIFSQVYLTSSSKVMGKYKNSAYTKWLLYVIGGIVTLLNVMLLLSFL
ncbi:MULTISPECIES: Nramp family divalent metal transporter [Odoribacteraceae]|uniref:Nramp family divalent metal transporter n=1 Tax=Odoribacteraceae TaxID=1853231 RepID=UPI000E555324|nr:MULTISPECIES: Nramp family divalent metal transporter [Odoribacteraceae]MCQ4873175.1 Nramp family divalent metal transporter [Butyricimonas paravirosa]RHR78917.1 divalent metal cation transporter [Odoribacter sp. AF15-53]